MPIIINYIFTLGYRCYSTDFIEIHKLRKMSGPFDYLYIDFETALTIINNKFADFLSDIILLNKNNKTLQIFYKKNTEIINENFYELIKNDIQYMSQYYNNNNLLINQNYIDNKNLSNNLYDWKSICIFLHHNLLDNNIYEKIKMRCERFNDILYNHVESTALLYITKIVNCNNIFDYINNIIKIKEIYNINSYIIMIINCDNIEKSHYFYDKEKCLFIIRNVENYDIQNFKYKIDNTTDYVDELKIMFNYFKFDIS
jgi:hypothetical protein